MNTQWTEENYLNSWECNEGGSENGLAFSGVDRI